MKGIRCISYLLVTCICFACRDPYEPRIISSSESFLVVEGVLNAGAGSTAIRLSRTFKLDDTARFQVETNASVTVEGKDNIIRPLTTNGDGFYTSPNLGLALGQEYRLRIVATNGKEYLSDYVVAKKTPMIDSVSFRQNDDGVQLYVTTHDDDDDTRYYLWNYDETWEIRTYYFSRYKYINNTVYERGLSDDVSICWKYAYSKSILIGSSALYLTDTIPQAPIHFIANGDERLAVRYSILVRQFALDKKSYQFYEMMKKNTESLGTIFDAQPSQIRGNIHAVSDPSEQVIGNISATTIEEKRIFIESTDLHRWRFRQECESFKIRNDPDSIAQAYLGGLEIYNAVFGAGGLEAYLFSVGRCVDCTKRDGSLVRPSYW